MKKNIVYALCELEKLNANLQKIFGFVGEQTGTEFFKEKTALHRCFEMELKNEIAWLLAKDENSKIKKIGFQTIQFYPASYSDLNLLRECKMHLHIFSVTYREALMLDFITERTAALLKRQLHEIQETISELKDRIQRFENLKMAV